MSDNQYNDNNHDAKISKNLLSFLSKKVDWITKELTTRQSISLLLGYPVIYPGEYHPKHDESTKGHSGLEKYHRHIQITECTLHQRHGS